MKHLHLRATRGTTVLFKLYPTLPHFRRAVKRLFPQDWLDPNVFGMQVSAGRKAQILLVAQDNLWRDCLLHECVHAADYLLRYCPPGVKATEFRAYFAQGLHDCFLKWAVNGFTDVREIDFSAALASLNQAFDPRYSVDTI